MLTNGGKIAMGSKQMALASTHSQEVGLGACVSGWVGVGWERATICLHRVAYASIYKHLLAICHHVLG